MGVLEIIAEHALGASLLKRKPELQRSLARLEECIATIVQLCFEYEREQDPDERKNILQTLEEVAANAAIELPKKTLEDFESDLIKHDRNYAQAEEKDRVETQEFLKKYFSLKAKSGLSTQQDVAKKTGLTRSYVTVIESGEHKPQQKTLQKLAKAFHVDVSEFV